MNAFKKCFYSCKQIEFIKPGVCHGIALWMDWVMDEENSTVISTGPGMRFLTLSTLLERDQIV
jgi:hypothetical protein